MENKRRTPPQQTRGRSRGQPPRRRTAPGQSTRPVDHRQPAQQNSGVRSRQRPPAQRSSAPSRPHPPAQRSPAPSRPRPPAKDPPPRRRRPSVGAAERRKRRRRRMKLFYLILFFLVIGTALTFAFTVLFRVETVEVRGESRYSAEEILKASGLQTGGNVFLTDTAAASDAVEKALPYIGVADVRRILPSGLEIVVEEEPVAGAVLDDTQYILVGVSGKVLDRVAEKPEGCPLIKGVAIREAPIGSQIVYEEGESREVFDKLSQAISAVNLDKVTEIDLEDSYDAKILYDGRILLEFGPPTAFEEKLLYFLDLLDEGKLTENDSGTLDLSIVPSTDRAYFSAGLVSSSVPSDASSAPASTPEPSSSS
ncbi:cell division protein FtsQ/DivIB [Anaeromassilibacillus sp. An200]|uniref:cell division protein FtsQ/DivIB n=1 Tax=Anaeromassilibacillus sp. An200 TaxID=1965587 RepID=UPI000B36ABDB|nr:FtsQ-type POTRA domain-containing protein [Anaeromassilibacillus sp. An200]OUP12012.1 hypothetical protein B5F35_09650 [Anaeromassilibacillus sp. An200]